MIPREDQERLRTLMVETITLLCKSGLQYKSEFSIDGLIGITVDSEDVFLVSLKETIKSALSGTDESTSVDSGYTKSSHRKRKISSRDRGLFDNQDSDDCTMSIESHADSFEDSDSSLSLCKNSVLLGKRATLSAAVGPLDHCLAAHSPPAVDASCHTRQSENVIVIKEESLSDEEYFAAQDLNIGHDVTITSDINDENHIKQEVDDDEEEDPLLATPPSRPSSINNPLKLDSETSVLSTPKHTPKSNSTQVSHIPT